MSELERIDLTLEKARDFLTLQQCGLCHMNKQCRERMRKGISAPGGCTGVFLAAVIAGIIDLDGNLIEGDEQ